MTTVVLSAGGTGGHLFPAQALAEELARRGTQIIIMTDRRGANLAKIFPDAVIETVPAATFTGRSLLRKFFAFAEIALGVAAAYGKLSRLKPAAVVGFGGYPSLPVMLAASFAELPTAILEQNTVLGRVNRLVADRMKVVAAAFPIVRHAPKDVSKIVMTGNPVRPEVIALSDAPYAPPDEEGPIRLVVFGGSQGARVLSEVVPAAIALLPDILRHRMEIVQQCRQEDLSEVRASYAAINVRAQLASFFVDLPTHMASAHLVISRSGAGTLSELAAIGRPAILIPFPYALDDHQTPNADLFVQAGAGWHIAQSDLAPPLLAEILEKIFADSTSLAERATAARTLAIPDATRRLADVVESIEVRV
jgi:UDP-N-acetylglucosamine--N-acetylmuramyl-(pentapeptide) pyrophosphoryl-undecaprenol N-acetylglucosamine transferase